MGDGQSPFAEELASLAEEYEAAVTLEEQELALRRIIIAIFDRAFVDGWDGILAMENEPRQWSLANGQREYEESVSILQRCCSPVKAMGFAAVINDWVSELKTPKRVVIGEDE